MQAYSDRGELVWQTDYDIYGGLRNLEGEREFIPFRQQGQYEDEETGLYYNRFRWYDPNTGNYISQDPIGLLGNNTTIYGYIHDSNVMTDILGLKGAVTAILEVGGKQYKGVSQTLFDKLEDSAFKDLIQDSLDKVKKEFDKCLILKRVDSLRCLLGNTIRLLRMIFLTCNFNDGDDTCRYVKIAIYDKN